jgi:hypothetical protein
MKVFKNILITIVLCSTGFIFAARSGTVQKPKGTPTTKPVVTPTPTKTEIPATQQQTYSSLLNQIKALKPGDVIANDTLNPTFIEFVKKQAAASNLSNNEIEALLQAGANIHAKWSGNPEKDKSMLMTFFSKIQNEIKPVLPVPAKKPTLPAPPKVVIVPEYYDIKTDLLKESYLLDRAKAELLNKTVQQVTLMLQKEFREKMLREWADRQVGNIVSLTKILNEQINSAVAEAKELIATDKEIFAALNIFLNSRSAFIKKAFAEKDIEKTLSFFITSEIMKEVTKYVNIAQDPAQAKRSFATILQNITGKTLPEGFIDNLWIYADLQKPEIEVEFPSELPKFDVGQGTILAESEVTELDPDYVANTVAKIVKDKGVAVKGESATMQKNRLIGLVKNELINGMQSYTKNLAALKTLVNTTLHKQITELVEQELIKIKPQQQEQPILFGEKEWNVPAPQDLPPTFLDEPVQEEDVLYFIDNFVANPANASKINNLKHAYDSQYSKEDSINLLKASTIVSSVVLKFLNNWTLAKQVLKQYLIATRGELLANGVLVGDAVDVLWRE